MITVKRKPVTFTVHTVTITPTFKGRLWLIWKAFTSKNVTFKGDGGFWGWF